MTTADKVRKVHDTHGSLRLHWPDGKSRRVVVSHLSPDRNVATFTWWTWRGQRERITLRIA